MIISTGDGFSICATHRNLKMGNVKKSPFVMNLSENQIRVMTIDAGKTSNENQSFESILIFENGYVKLNCSNMTARKIKSGKESSLTMYGKWNY